MRKTYPDPGTLAGIAVILAVAVAMFLLTLGMRAHATTHYAGEWDKVDPATRSWFKSQRSPHGVPCCDMADGHPTLEDWRGQNEYWIPNPVKLGEIQWIKVPPEAVIYNARNPTGEAVVWYVIQGSDTVYIRCFVPGGGV
jgi:hypothetical protein